MNTHTTYTQRQCLHTLQGVSLIEILLVIVIIAIISVGGISLTKNKVEKAKITNAVEQVEAMAMAARTYYESKQTHWPESLTALNDFLPPTHDASKLKNPWGYALDIAPAGSKPFYVTTRLPNNRVARAVQAQLPLSQIRSAPGTDDYILRLYLTTPAPIAWEGINLGASIVNMQTITLTTSHDFTLPTLQCPAHYRPNWVAGMHGFSKANDTDDWQFLAGVTLCSGESTSDECRSTGAKPPLANQLRLRINSWTSVYSGSANVMLLQFCEPTPQAT